MSPTPFALANGNIQPSMFGITRQTALGIESTPVSERVAFRRKLVAKYANSDYGQKELLAELARAMATPANDNIKRMASTHWISRILDTSSTFGGNILPRVDIEDYLYALFVTMFPMWERLRNGPANGLLHTWDTITAPGQVSVTDATITVATESTVGTADTSQYKQVQTCNIATFLEQRGITMKEQFAVAQSGMSYNPETQEIEDGVIRLKDVIQRQLFQGNFGTSSGAGANTELGAFNANGFDGLRLIVGGLGTYNTLAVRVDQDLLGKTIVQAINAAAARVNNNGGNSSIALLSATAIAAIMDEQEGKQRVLGTMELIPGVKINAVQSVNGPIGLVPVPGLNAIGQYSRTSDAKQVEDIYILDERMVYRRWLGSPDINVLELPAGISGALTRTFLIFAFNGLQVADSGLFQAKVRIPQTLQ